MTSKDLFYLEGTVLRVSDPCYTDDTWCAGLVRNCIPGWWTATVIEKDKRCGELIVTHADYLDYRGKSVTKKLPFSVGVDSGQCGVFVENNYRAPISVPFYSEFDGGITQDFYAKCCDITLNPPYFGVMEYGAVSSSGWGDGSYVAYARMNPEGEVFEITVDFLCDDDEEGYYNDDEYDDE